MSSAQEVLADARDRYDRATQAFRSQKDLGAIVPLDRSIPEEDDEYAKGVRLRCVDGMARAVFAEWQKCKADLDAAAANLQRERGDMSCPVCDRSTS